MSHQDISLKAACADSFHYPSEWNPSRGSLDQFQRARGFEHHFGKHRTKNLHKGLLLIRFEMPFKVQCLRCNTYIGQGTRYDADKKKVGKYFSTPLYEFEMRCSVVVGHEKSADGRVYCNQRFVIRTDPQNEDYALVEGLRRKVDTWDAADAENLELTDPETRRKMETDPMFKVEKTIRDTQREKSQKERLAILQDMQDEREDTYALNCRLRRSNRERRKEELAKEEAERQPKNFAIPLAPACSQDLQEAKSVVFRTDFDKVEVAAKRAAIRAGPLIKRSQPGSSQESGSKLSELAAKRRRLASHARMAQVFSTGR